jgi:integrase
MITTSEINTFIVKRQADTIVTGDGDTRKERTVSNGEINRELTALKRMFTLAVQAGKILHRPHIPMLRENNVRTGFFEFDQFRSLRAHLSEPLRPVVTFAYITGWRVTDEVLPLEWRRVDFKSGEIRLDVGTTKNRDGRVFKMTDDLRTLLDERHRETKEIERTCGQIIPWVFFRWSRRDAATRSNPNRSRHSRRRGKRRVSPPGVRAASRMIFGERRSATWSAPEFPSASP